MINVGIVGATGYVGVECIRLLLRHKEVCIKILVSHSYVGQKISKIYPTLKGILDLECKELDIDELAGECDVVITALPHGASMEVIPSLLEKGVKVIDASGDFRYTDPKVYEQWYKLPHTAPEALKSAVYGLCEINREKIKKTGFVANQGCYPTCSVLGLAPLMKTDYINKESIIINSVSGVSGAGRKAELANTVCELNENFKPYGVATHRHTSEIEQELSELAGTAVTVSFTPHLAPIKRGMLSTIYVNMAKAIDTDELLALYKEYYKDDYFVRILDKGVLPEIKFVSGSNFVDIGIVADKRTNRIIIMSCQDNLCKGAAGQIVQNLNLMCGFDEKEALDFPGLYL